MKPSYIQCLPLLAGVFLVSPAGAQALAQPPTAAPCYRAYCGDLAERTTSAATLPKKESWQRSGAREWQASLARREQAEDFNCLLSIGVGGELRSNGYQGARLLGQTRTLHRANAKESR